MSARLPELVKVVRGTGEFSSKLVSRVDREPGSLLTKIENWAPAPQRTYTTVQASESSDIELNTDMVYSNHSCDPSVIFDMRRFEVRVGKDRPLKQGDDITFFYPSTEWDMNQHFQCNCGSDHCLGTVSGAKYLDESTLRGFWLNPHIERLLAERKKHGGQ